MISLVSGSTEKVITLQNDRMLIIEGGTWDDYWAISHEDIKVEFIEEEIFIHSPASLEHEEIFGYLFTEFRSRINSGKILGSRFPIKLIDGKRVEPDLLYLSPKDLMKGELTNTVFEGSPSFIVEIVSPNYRTHDTETKLEKYCELGVKEYWVVDPELKELRQILFQDFSEVNSKLYTEGQIKPTIGELKHINVNVLKLWSFRL